VSETKIMRDQAIGGKKNHVFLRKAPAIERIRKEKRGQDQNCQSTSGNVQDPVEGQTKNFQKDPVEARPDTLRRDREGNQYSISSQSDLIPRAKHTHHRKDA